MAGFDVYHKWLGISPEDQPPNHYRLLGVPLFESDPEVIEAAADQRMTYVQQCVTGAHVAESQRMLNELSAARVCLLNPNTKASYDAVLRREIETRGEGRGVNAVCGKRFSPGFRTAVIGAGGLALLVAIAVFDRLRGEARSLPGSDTAGLHANAPSGSAAAGPVAAAEDEPLEASPRRQGRDGPTAPRVADVVAAPAETIEPEAAGSEVPAPSARHANEPELAQPAEETVKVVDTPPFGHRQSPTMRRVAIAPNVAKVEVGFYGQGGRVEKAAGYSGWLKVNGHFAVRYVRKYRWAGDGKTYDLWYDHVADEELNSRIHDLGPDQWIDVTPLVNPGETNEFVYSHRNAAGRGFKIRMNHSSPPRGRIE